jgi:hypothetical protein
MASALVGLNNTIDQTDNWLTLTLKYKSQDLTLMTASPSQQDPQKSLQTPAVKSYSSQTIPYTRDVKDKDNAEVDTKIVTNKPEKVSINQLQTAPRQRRMEIYGHRIMKEKTVAGTK